MNPPQLILASSSPARKEILEQARIDFVVEPSHYEEDMTLAMPPRELAMHLSQGKARAVATRHTDAVVIGADSFGIFDGQLLGKPHTLERAKEMLTMLSGQQHSFITGFTLIDCAGKREISDAVETKVFMRKLSPAEIDGYLAKEDVLEWAAAYRIQHLGGILMEKIEGDFNNVRGLPLSVVAEKLKAFGVQLI